MQTGAAVSLVLDARTDVPEGTQRSVADTARAVIRGLGQLLITVGLVILLFAVYELWVTNIYTSRQQEALGDALRHSWSAPPQEMPATVPSAPAAGTGTPAAAPVPPFGDAFAVLRIPRFGPDYDWTVVEGVTRDALRDGPGHYPGTALPGQVGNFVLSGHRTTYGAPFKRLAELRPGDAVVVETRDSWFTYRLTSQEIVAPTDTSVILPVPHQPGVAASQAMLTMTTCHPMYSAKQRLIVYAALESSQPKTAGLPPALATA